MRQFSSGTHSGHVPIPTGATFLLLKTRPESSIHKERGWLPAWLGLSLCSDNQNISGPCPNAVLILV